MALLPEVRDGQIVEKREWQKRPGRRKGKGAMKAARLLFKKSYENWRRAVKNF
jgi:hypothetical protein